MTRRLPVQRGRTNPLLRVVRAAADPLEGRPGPHGGRWSPRHEYPVLYTSADEFVSRAFVVELLRRSNLVIEDLADDVRPVIAKIAWSGEGVDVATSAGVAAAGLPATYPDGVDHSRTQPLAREWRQAGEQSVVCRSASLRRLGFSAWGGDHERWSEVAIFTDRAIVVPRLVALAPVPDDWLTLAPRLPGV